MHFDVVHAADPRFPGGTSSALRAELKAARRFGLHCALLPFAAMRGRLVRAFEPRLADLIDELDIPWLTADREASCDLLFAHHPQVFQHMPAQAVRLRPKRVVCVVHHPPFDGFWTPQYDFGIVERNLERMFGAPVSFAPVGPKVRRQFETLPDPPPLLRRDLTEMVDLDEWVGRRRAPPARAAVLGRHSRPDPLKWPDSREELLAAYPDEKHLGIRVLGGVPVTIEPWIGSNWAVLPFATAAGAEFLSRLDFYVYFHSRRWVEAFGISIAEAMASGLVTVLDHSYEPLFGEGAVYARADEVAGVVDAFISSPEKFAGQSDAARQVARERFSLETYRGRMAELYDNLELPLPAILGGGAASHSRGDVQRTDSGLRGRPARTGRPKRILFVATNGIGLGHITRLMAIAERMAGDVEPVFFTRSAGSAIIHERGFAVDYVPWAVKSGVTDHSWNVAYAQELLAAIETMGIDAVVFDGTYPFPGLVEVAAVRPDLAWIWVRRPLWVQGQRLDKSLQYSFNMIIEPGELAGDEDHGPTQMMPGPIVTVGPVLLRNPRTGLTREEAARKLGIDPARRTVVIQLGSRRNFDFEDLPGLLTAELLRHDLQVVQVENPLARRAAEQQPGVLYRNCYPLSDCFDAIDLMVTNAGYNSFHECIFGGVPSIFVPNEAPEMDYQHLRAAYAHSTGLGLMLRATDLGRVEDTVERALSADLREELRRRTGRLTFVNGAHAAARSIEQLVFSVRANAPLHEFLAKA